MMETKINQSNNLIKMDYSITTLCNNDSTLCNKAFKPTINKGGEISNKSCTSTRVIDLLFVYIESQGLESFLDWFMLCG